MPTEIPPRPFDSPRPISPSAAVAIPSFLARVYVWMAAGLLVTAGTAFATLSSPTLLRTVFGNKIVFFGIMIAELGLVAWLSGMVGRLSSTAAGTVFVLYSALNGLTLSVVFLAYTSASIVSTFVVTAGMFGAMSVYGLVTKRELDGLGSFAFMGLIGVILASVVNIFVRSDAMGFVISCVGVIVFTALTAYDTKKLRIMAMAVDGASEEGKRASISGALRLYLDFINLFLMLLRFFGNRR
jgi:FtsH-binding integral membrane protein